MITFDYGEGGLAGDYVIKNVPFSRSFHKIFTKFFKFSVKFAEFQC